MKLRRGQVARITFHDHAEGRSTMRFVAVGRVASITSRAITLEHWYYARSKKIYAANVESNTIVRAAIEKIEIATRWENINGEKV